MTEPDDLSRIRRSVTGLQSTAVDSEMCKRLASLLPDWNFGVRGTADGLIQVHIWKDGRDESKSVNPFDYVNVADPWARSNPEIAAVEDGIRTILENLG